MRALIAKAREAEGLRLELLTQAQTSLWHEEDAASARADLATARAQLVMAREALERISYKRSSCRSADHFECAELFGDCLDIAAYALSQLPEASK